MRQIFLYSISLVLLSSCKKEHGSRVDIFLLKSFNVAIDTTKTPAFNTITNAVLADTPLVADQTIEFYTKGTYTFNLSRDIQSVIQNYGHDKAFALTVDNRIVYYGVFHPMYLSSMVIGLATISPFLGQNNELKVDFVNLSGTYVSELDKRNDSRIIDALRTTGRLK